MTQFRLALDTLLAAALRFTMLVNGAAPNTLGYQGRLTQKGVAVTGSVSVVFSLYGAPSCGTALCSKTQSVTVASGL